MIDHVTSIPSVVIPVKELIKICREEGVDKVFIDGAHGIGCVDVDMKETGADLYISTLNRWFFLARLRQRFCFVGNQMKLMIRITLWCLKPQMS